MDDPDELLDPTLSLLVRGRSPLQKWSRRLWQLAGHEKMAAFGRVLTGLPRIAISKPTLPPEIGDRWKPPIYLEKRPDEEAYRLITLRDENLNALLNIIEMEFIREQLYSGKGLYCIFDAIRYASQTPPYDDYSEAHHHMMKHLWEITRLTDRPEEGMHWDKPSCVTGHSKAATCGRLKAGQLGALNS